jgi:hypothetical protein
MPWVSLPILRRGSLPASQISGSRFGGRFAVRSRNIATFCEDFYKEARKPRTNGKPSWFLGFLMVLFLVAAFQLSVFHIFRALPFLFPPSSDGAVTSACFEQA